MKAEQINTIKSGEIYYRDLTATNTTVPVWPFFHL